MKIALELAQRCTHFKHEPIDPPSKNVDDIIIHLAKQQKNWIVATNDRELRKKLREHQIPVITLRKKAILSIDGIIPS